jgi:hypothetical protein
MVRSLGFSTNFANAQTYSGATLTDSTSSTQVVIFGN